MNKKTAQIIGLAIALVVLCAFCSGCTSMCKSLFPNQCGKTAPGETVFVTDYEKPTKLPVPEKEESKLTSVDDNELDWRIWLDAISNDSLMCHDALDACIFVIESYNKAVDEAPSE